MRTEYITILGTKISKLTEKYILKRIEEDISQGKKRWIVTPNPEIVLLAHRDPEFRAILNQADMAIADGVGLLAAAEYQQSLSRLQEKKSLIRKLGIGFVTGGRLLFNRRALTTLPEQISGDQLMDRFFILADKHMWKVYLLGGEPGIAQTAVNILANKYPQTTFGGHSGPHRVSDMSSNEAREILDDINEFAPHFLFVAFGAPLQERWIYENLGQLKVNLAMGVGGSIDVIAGKLPATPEWLRQAGLRWLWRGIIEPVRWKRIVRAVIVFPWMVFKETPSIQDQ